jgi:YHS domain-containing protein
MTTEIRNRAKGKKTAPEKKTAKDPVCGTDVDVAKSPKDVILEHEVYFCSEECRQNFRAGASGRKAKETPRSKKRDHVSASARTLKKWRK